MPHFLDNPSYPFELRVAQELHELLWTNIDSLAATRQVLRTAKIHPALINMTEPLYLVWASVLDAAAKQGKVRDLLDAVRREPLVGAALAPRLDELSRPAPPLQTVLPPAPIAWINEAITGDASTLLDVRFLLLGAERARSVVRLSVSFEDGSSTVGTGFLIRPDVVISNHHVLFHEGSPATHVVVRFDYERTVDGGPSIHSDMEAEAASIRGVAAVDTAFLRVKAPGSRAPLGVDKGAPPAPGDRVYIIQHPGGGPKKIGMIHNHVAQVQGHHVQYLTDTLPGSSGSPVFNERWEVVAIHHRGVRAPAAKGQEIRNQGILIGAALDALSPLGLG